MPRFTKQHDSYSCGPAAIANALKWAGNKLSYREHKQRLCNILDCKYPTGVTPNRFNKGLLRLSREALLVDRADRFSIPRLRTHVAKDEHAAIIRFVWPDTDTLGHYIFVHTYNPRLFGGMYQVVNLYCDGRADRWVTHKQFTKLISRRSAAICWLIKKDI